MFKNIYKSFSSDTRSVLNKYSDLIKQSEYITQELFPKKLNSGEQFEKLAGLKRVISKNITLKDQTPIDSLNAAIFTPCWDLLNRKGKKWRPMLGLMVADYYKFNIHDMKKNKLLYQVLSVTELIHNASLIIDDIEDKSEQRRDEPCVHLKFGEDIAINAGISMFFLPIYILLQNIDDQSIRSRICQAYFEEMTAIHLGQGWDIEMKVGNRIPSVDNYKDTVIFKTGVCPRLIVKLIHAISTDPIEVEIKQAMLNLADHLSIAFQIKDDLLNLVESDLAKRKGFVGEDIYEGKLTLMILHTLNHNDGNKDRLKEILYMKTKDERLIREAIDILKKNGSIEFAEKIMDYHANKVYEICNNLTESRGYNQDGVLTIKTLTDYLCNRNI
jgi:geranylgeranyl pyrophosphate synthase